MPEQASIVPRALNVFFRPFSRHKISSKRKTGGMLMKVKDIMTFYPMCCNPLTSLREVAQMMLECDCEEIPVVDNIIDLRPIGMITDRDIVCRALALGKNPLELTAAECMSPLYMTVTPETSLENCCRAIKISHTRRIPVVDGHGSCCGIVSQTDFEDHHLNDDAAETAGHLA